MMISVMLTAKSHHSQSAEAPRHLPLKCLNMVVDIDTLVAWGSAFKTLRHGEIIFQETEQSHFFYQLVSGRVRLINITEDGKEFIQGIVDPGESFGEMPLFDNEGFAVTAIADVDSVIIRLHKATFLQLLHDRPDIHFAITKTMIERLRVKTMLLKEFSRHNPNECINALFGYMRRTRKNISGDSNRLNLTRQQIANMTGLRVETVIRTIQKLHDKGLLQIDRGKIYL